MDLCPALSNQGFTFFTNTELFDILKDFTFADT